MKKDIYNRAPENMKLTETMYADICHHLNNDLAIIINTVKIHQDQYLMPQALNRLELMATYIKSINVFVEDEE